MVKIIKTTASMQTRDGVRLDADIYHPDTDEKLPILLMRQPYGREIASTVVYAHPRWYAARGYIVVIQDVRGRGSSEGKFDLFTHEVADGLDTVEWVSQLPKSTGKVGMYGFSYQGMTQLYAAANQPKALKAIAPAMVAWDLHHDWAYENGAFCLYASLAWAIQLAGETARLAGDEATYLELYRASRNLPLNGAIPANPKLMKDLAPESFYHQWLNNPDPDAEYWQKRSPKYLLADTDLPMLHVGGWFDPYLRGTLNLYREMAGRSNYPQHLLAGPWGHLPWGRKLGAIDYGKNAQNSIDEIQIRWFDYWLKDIDSGLLAEAPISLFEMGSNQWREYDSLESKSRTYYLASDGLANIRDDGGMLWQGVESDPDVLSQQEPLTKDLEEAIAELGNQTDFIVHDPWRPVPALGGHASYPGGSCDRSGLDCRADILTYTSAPLESDLHILGEVNVELYCSTDQPSFDLCAVLSVVEPNGKVFNFTQGYTTVKENTSNVSLVRLALQSTCMCIAAGNSLRLSLSASCFPAYPVNAGTGKLPQEARLMEMQIITLAIHSGEDYPSQIKLGLGNG
ncbi:MAG: CocE/NonD family hydrolase [Cyanobacteria bacterium P01_G01_bin.19]